MKPSAVCFVASLIIWMAGSASGEERDFESNVYGNLYETTVTDDAVANAPAWNNDDDNPPLSAKRATQIAKRKAAILTEGLEHFAWRLTSLSLEPLGDGWFWLVTITAPPTDTTRAMPLRIAILMDGTVVEPKKKEAPKPAATPSA